MSSKPGAKTRKTSRKPPQRRTPRTLTVEAHEPKSGLPAIITEAFNNKNIDVVGKIDDMRAMTKELSIMARQLEQWVGIAYTIGMAFKDNGILKELMKAVSSVGTGEGSNTRSREVERPQQKERKAGPPPFPLPFFRQQEQEREQERENYEENSYQEDRSNDKGPSKSINFMEILSNPAFQEIVSKIFLSKK